MVDLPKKKVGIVACSGEELPEGTITRLAALRVLEQLRPGDTVTICLPLFLAGGEGDRAFARFYPTIAVDGCELRCAARATEIYSNKPAASFMVRDIIVEKKLGQPEGRRRLNEAGLQAADITAQKMAEKVDELLGQPWNRREGELIQIELMDEHPYEVAPEHVVATCACGSGIPIQDVIIRGRLVSIVGLPIIFQQFSEAGKSPTDGNVAELMEMVKIYNPIPAEEQTAYRDGIRKAYSKFWFKEKGK